MDDPPRQPGLGELTVAEADVLAQMLELQAELLARQVLGDQARNVVLRAEVKRRILTGELPLDNAQKRVSDAVALQSRVSDMREQDAERSKRRYVAANRWKDGVAEEYPWALEGWKPDRDRQYRLSEATKLNRR